MPMTANSYATRVICELPQGAQTEPSHTVCVLIEGCDEDAVSTQQTHLKTCEEYLLAAKLRELGTVLLSALFGVKHPYTVVLSDLVPQQHFMNWLVEVRDTNDHIRKIFSDIPDHLVATSDKDSPASKSTTSLPPRGETTEDYPDLRRASILTIDDLYTLLAKMTTVTSNANNTVHELTVQQVLLVLQDTNLQSMLGTESCQKLVDLVEAILGFSARKPRFTAAVGPDTNFKRCVKGFRKKVHKAWFLTKVEIEWKEKWMQALAGWQVEELERRDLVVKKADVSKAIYFIQCNGTFLTYDGCANSCELTQHEQLKQELTEFREQVRAVN